MQKSKMKLEQGNSSEVSLIRELSTLKKSRSLRDPSTSPSWKSGSLVQKFERGRRKNERSVQSTHSQTLERVGSVSSKLGASAALDSVTDVPDEGDESSEQEGWVEISPGDGKHLQATHAYPHQDSHVSNDGDHLQFMAELRNEGSILHNWNTNSGVTELLNAIKERNSGNQNASTSLLLQSAGDNQGSSKDDSLSKDDDSVDSDKERSTFDSDSTGLNWRTLTLIDRAGANMSGEADELEISEISQNGCGMPWNWSRIHTRGKNLLDIAGRSAMGGPSDHLTRRLAKVLSKGHLSSSEESMPMTSEFSDTSLNTDSESFPLLEHGVQSDIGSPSEVGQGDHTGRDQTESILLFPRSKERRHLGPSLLSNDNSHHSLSEKFAPKSFQEVVGQGLITQALSNALLKGRIASLYIFHGPQGTGKTSCARIFAIALNCTSADKLKPCGSCSECLAHKFGKTSILKEFTAGGLQSTKGMKKMIHEVTRAVSFRYRVFIVDECHILSTHSWNAFMKAVEEAPKNVVFVLCTSSLEQLPHAVISRCQKFIFSKIKENDVVNRLQIIARQEGLEVDAEALKLVASACDGSLRDAEMMLDQLSLLGQKISLSMVQELMGLVSDEQLVDLLDFALSADTVNTVRSLKDLMVGGVEPLNLMSQLACLITSLLAGGYQIPKGRYRRKFFRRKHLAKEDMERLRQALKTLSEAEKQLRVSSDRTTWLTAALLQFAPDQSYLLPSSSAETSFTQSPAGVNNAKVTVELNPLYSRQVELQHQRLSQTASGSATEGLSNGMSSSPKATSSDLQRLSVISQKKTRNHKLRVRGSQLVTENGLIKTLSSSKSGEVDKKTSWQTTLTNEYELEELWQRVLDAVHSSSLRKFLQTQGKLLSVSLCKGFAVAILEFSQPENSSRAERSRTSIAHAFQATLGCPIDVKVQRALHEAEQPRRVTLSGDQPSGSSGLWQPAWSSGDGKAYSSSMSLGKSGQLDMRSRSLHSKKSQSLEVFRGPPDFSKSQNASNIEHALEINAAKGGKNRALPAAALESHPLEDKLENAWVQGARDGVFFTRSSSKAGRNHQEGAGFRQDSVGKNRVSLGFVIQQAEGSVDEYSRDVEFDRMNEGSSHHLRHSVGYEGRESELAARLEEENLRLESRSGGLLCWKLNDKALEKGKQSEESAKKSGFLMNLCPCGKSEQS
ncbi:hypothetical protein GOP47_0012348 [Adiantum capillus-veneris]|uniref:Uncharacterized protein n=1 Tax=Adiantum capillus-veneris TaxID=13818 RepID=A0A9D4UR06_ADICA|nr:hypothetical protein GOP47_0012348 [Adiantum capillus-veneris]